MTPRLADRYEAFLLDLDGVVFRGDRPVPGAPEAVAALRQAGRRVVFITNNSSRTPGQVAETLEGLGVPASADDVVNSALAAAALVADDAGDGSRRRSAFVIGEEGIRRALEDAGIRVLDGDPGETGYVVVGWDREVTYDRLRTAALLVRRGARFIATNADPTYPAPGGELWPGAGSLLAAVETASGARATVVGKPRRGLLDAAARRAGTRDALVVGDRIDTDVAGAHAAGLDAALVFSGAAKPADLLDHDTLPVAAMHDLGGLLQDRPAATLRGARPPDEEALRALLRSAGLDPRDQTDLDGTVVAARDGDVLATATAETADREGYLRLVAVREDARGAFVGALVTAAAVRGAAASGAREVYLLTETAEGFFAALGFDRIDRELLPGWLSEQAAGCGRSAVAMRREIRRGAG